MKFLSSLAKQTLKNTQDLRKIKNTIFDTFHCKVDHLLVTSVQEERAKYVKHQQSVAHSDRLEFGPSVPMMRILLEVLKEADIGAANRTTMVKLAEDCQAAAATELEESLGGLYIEKCKEPTMIKLLIGMQHLPHRLVIIQSMKQLGFKHMTGSPPPGFLENQLSDFLQSLEGK
jgi:hypothetical protein